MSKLKSMKRSVLGRRVVNKIKRPEKIVPTIGGYFCFTTDFSLTSGVEIAKFYTCPGTSKCS